LQHGVVPHRRDRNPRSALNAPGTGLPQSARAATHAPGIGDQFDEPFGVDVVEPHEDEWHAVVGRHGEEELRLTEQQGLLLGLVAHVQHSDVPPDDPSPTRHPLGVRPDETLARDTEVEALNDAIRAGAAPPSTTPFRTETADLGTPSVNLDRALQVAADLEDDELIRRMRVGK
jgi:hypothetical protein